MRIASECGCSGGYLICLIECLGLCAILWRVDSPHLEKTNEVDTTLFDIYTNLGLAEIMRSADVEEFLNEEVEGILAGSHTAAA